MRGVVSFLIVGYLLFYGMATFEIDLWKKIYFIWDKGKDVLVFYALWQVSKKKYGDLVKLPFYFTLIRFIWEIISNATGVNINNSKWAGAFFILIAIYVLFKTARHDRN